MKLSDQNLHQFNGVKVPSYDRSKLKAGIVHIGVGNFHRAHQAWYLHRLMEKGLANDWAIIGAGVRPYDEQMRKKLKAQDYLTTLIELSPEKRSAEIIGSMIDYLPITDGNGALIAQMVNPAIRIVSLTATEGGYFIEPSTKDLDAKHPEIQHDAKHPDRPQTAFGAIVAALKIRREQGLPAFACLSCDNLQGNGKIMRQTVVSLAKMTNPELADWIDTHCSFPNSMVDSIVPATGSKELAFALELGIEDLAPVTHENFRQWVVEDAFCAGRPPWEEVGAILSNHVHAYELMKLRVLNGGHQIIAATADLLGLHTTSDAMEHRGISALFEKVEQEEIIPHVKAVAEFTPQAYVKLIDKRFRNPSIHDTTRRVAFDGSSRQPSFLLPSATDCLNGGIPPKGLAFVSAIWARYCLGQREDGSSIKANDPFWDDLQQRALAAKENPKIWLENRSVYGDFIDQIEFAKPFGDWLSLIHQAGVENALHTFLKK